jgi:hypothetical protein
MRYGWLADRGNHDGLLGGAEFTQAEFRAAAPDGVDIVFVPSSDPGTWLQDCDRVCVFNCTEYPDSTIRSLTGKPVVRYWNDVAPHGSHKLTRWLVENAENVFTSPLHMQRFPWTRGTTHRSTVIPPPVDLDRFRAVNSGQDRTGNVSIAAWRGWGKTPHLTQAWGKANGGVDFYGPGEVAPPGCVAVPYEAVPDILARYETFVYLPTALEPFCRATVEAWAAGCKVVSNRLVGANHFIENDPDALETAADRFWELATA